MRAAIPSRPEGNRSKEQALSIWSLECLPAAFIVAGPHTMLRPAT
jgi:hypothetical protein